MLLSNGPLRPGLTAEDAAATYSTLSNPNTYALLVGERGWSGDQFEQWRRLHGTSRAPRLTSMHRLTPSGTPAPTSGHASHRRLPDARAIPDLPICGVRIT